MFRPTRLPVIRYAKEKIISGLSPEIIALLCTMYYYLMMANQIGRNMT